MSSLKNQIKEEITNFVSGKKYIPSSKEELISHFSSYYDKNEVEEVVSKMLDRYELVTTARKNIQSARNSGIFIVRNS